MLLERNVGQDELKREEGIGEEKPLLSLLRMKQARKPKTTTRLKQSVALKSESFPEVLSEPTQPVKREPVSVSTLWERVEQDKVSPTGLQGTVCSACGANTRTPVHPDEALPSVEGGFNHVLDNAKIETRQD